MKYKKLILFGIMLTLTIPICMYISTIIHFILTDKFVSISDMGFNTVIESIFKDNQNLKVYILLQFLFSLFLILVTFIQRDNIFESKLGNITDKIKTPFIVGQGQHGTARWLKQNEFEKTFKKNVLELDVDIDKQSFTSAGLVVGYKKLNNGNEEIYCVDTNTHSLTVGATRSGKSRTIVLQTITTLALAGESIIVSDPKRRTL